MFSTIVIGLDGGPGGEDALLLGHGLAEPDARLIGVCVDVGARDGTARQAALDTATRIAFIDASVEPEAVAAPSVAAGLHAAARRHGADLIVVGSSRRGAIGRVLAGDDAARTARDAPCAVAVAPAGHAAHPHRLARVAVGHDGGPEADAALDAARAIAAQHHATVEAIAAVGLPSWALTAGAVLPESLDDLSATQQRLDRLDGVTGRVVRGAPIPALIELAAEYDLLVVGSRHHGRIGRVLMGSTAQALAHSARAPLLVVPPAPVPAAAAA
jgi:nucleotide-binding universal stress UspA family protein